MVKTGAKRKVQTHFAQVPLKIVEKVMSREAARTEAAIKSKGAGRKRLA